MRNGGPKERRVVYCLIPRELAGELHGMLREHFRDDPGIAVVVDDRARERRSGEERRRASKPASGHERRQIKNAAGRRVGERRAELVSSSWRPPLPRRARRRAERLRFVERAEPDDRHGEDLDTARLVIAFQGGDREAAFSALYARHFDRVYAYLRMALKSRDEAEDATQQVFLRVFEALPNYERRRQPFRAWLFRIVRNFALSELRRLGRVEPIDPQELLRRNGNQEEEPELNALEWVTDRDLLIFIERLPMPQRQVLVLRFMLDLSDAQVAAVLGRSASDVRALQSRALKFLRQRLVAIGRTPYGERRKGWRVRTRQAQVLRRRRYALVP